MLSPEDNELLVRVGPGTVMGNLFRRFWTPVMLASELRGPDSAPVKVNVLGEKLVAFRDSAGRIGLLDTYCPHRRANLFWGRNEEAGLRCIYHGWKFDVAGRCTDLPNCPEGETLKDRVTTTAYPTLERGGLIWAYLGPAERQPEFPHYEGFHAPESHRFIRKVISKGNYLQLLEGDCDSSHLGFLHNDADGIPGGRVDQNAMIQRMPRWFPQETAYGLMLAAQRDAGPEQYHWRINQFLMPYITLIAAPPATPVLNQVRVPIDDETSLQFRCFVHPDRPLNAEERAIYDDGVTVPEVDPVTFETVENIGNDYRIDRERQRTSSYSGIRSIVAQDLAVTQDQGGGWIADRSREYLVSSDRAIIMLRKRLLTAGKALRDGIEPPEAHTPDAVAVRPADFMLPRDVSPETGLRRLVHVGASDGGLE